MACTNYICQIGNSGHSRRQECHIAGREDSVAKFDIDLQSLLSLYLRENGTS